MRRSVIRTCIICGILFVFVIMAASVSADRMDELTESVKGYLTEVYGYSQDEADGFVFHDAGGGLFQCWQDDEHSEWVYEFEYNTGNCEIISASTPFYNGTYSWYPGEGTVRRVAGDFTRNQWLDHWDEETMKAFEVSVDLFRDVQMTEELKNGLTEKKITATEAIHEFFLSCYGNTSLWTNAVFQWLDELTGTLDTAFAEKTEKEQEPAHHLSYGSVSADMTYFSDQIPEQLPVSLITEKGWEVLRGVLCDVHSKAKGEHQLAFVIFARGAERQAVLFSRDTGNEWRTLPYGNKMIYPDTDPSLNVKQLILEPDMTLCYTMADGVELEAILSLLPDKCSLKECTVTNPATGDRFYIHYNGGSMNETWGWTETKNGTKDSGAASCMASQEYAAMVLSELPRDSVSMRQWQPYEIPEGYLMLRGVHLRSKKSSRSADLGMFKAGTLVRNLGMESGNPDPWVHAQIGLLQGYVSSSYVNVDNNGISDSMLPVFKTLKDTSLKNGMGWFSRTVSEIPAGTKMHVLAEYDRWYYVDVPRGTIHYLMDVDGTYGYIPKDCVTESSLMDECP